MICPRCEVALVEVRLDDVAIDRCERCAGIWFDFMELERVLTRDTAALRRLLPEPDLPEPVPAQSLPCPRCADRLLPVRSPDQALTFFTCLTCYGRWLDGHELARAVDRGMALKFERVLRLLLDAPKREK